MIVGGIVLGAYWSKDLDLGARQVFWRAGEAIQNMVELDNKPKKHDNQSLQNHRLA
jgi:hypothetical protein